MCCVDREVLLFCFFVGFSGQILWVLSQLIFLLNVTGFKAFGLTLGCMCLWVFPESSNQGSLTYYTCGGEQAPSLGLGIQIQPKLKTGARKISTGILCALSVDNILCVLSVDISYAATPMGEPGVKAILSTGAGRATTLDLSSLKMPAYFVTEMKRQQRQTWYGLREADWLDYC